MRLLNGRAVLVALSSLVTLPVALAEPPRHPIVLMHGFLGNGREGPLGYWGDVPALLARRGIDVTVAGTSPAATPFDRARGLERTLVDAAARSPTGRVNVVAHSMGGLDARVLASHLGHASRIASITTLASPHRGSPLADLAVHLLGNDCVSPALPAADASIGWLFGVAAPQDLLAGLRQLSPAAMSRFNETIVDDPRTTYLSIVARTTFDLGEAIDGADLVDAPLLPTFALLDRKGLANDGLVPVDSQRWGDVIAVVAADHQNLVGQPFGLTGLQFDHRHFFRFLADELARRGL